MTRTAGGLSAFLLASILIPASVYGELSGDTHITRDDHVRLDIDNITYSEFKRLYDEGYPPASVMLHGIALGLPIDDLVYMAVRSDPNRGQEFYDTAVNLVPAVPGWACRTGDIDDRYVGYVSVQQFGSQPTIAAVANEWFKNKRVITPFPNWQEGTAHLNVSVGELANLVDSRKYWYTPGASDGTGWSVPKRPLFVALYRDNDEIVVDGELDRIQQARQQGKTTMPVVVVYNQSFQRPLSRFGANVTLRELADEFFNNRIEITPVPSWEVGDYHKMATLDELRDVVKFPKKSDVPSEEWSAIEAEINANGGAVKKPLLLTLLRSGSGEVWVNSPATLAVAESMGVKELPVVLFYHDIDRQPCGVTSSCEDNICAAVVAGGGTEAMCKSSKKSASLPRAGDTVDSGNDNDDRPLG